MQARADARELELVIEGFERRGRSLTHVLPAIGEALVSAVSDVYDAEGPGWEPLAASTLKRRRGGASAKILQDSSIMVQSTHPDVGSTWAEASAGVDYAEFHASSAPRKKIPRRDPFTLGPFEGPLLDEVSDMLLDEAVKG